MNREISVDYILEMFVLGRLSRELAREVEDRLNHDPEYQAKLDEIRQSDGTFFDKYPSSEVIPEIMRRYNRVRSEEMPVLVEKKTVFFRRLLVASPAFAFVVILLLLILPPETSDSPYPFLDSQTDVTRIKGIHDIDMSKTQLLIHRKRDGHVELLKNGVTGHAGDLLQLGYVAGLERYGVILSIDGRSNVTLHFPEDESHVTALTSEGSVYFPNAIELDNAPEFERFFFLTSQSMIDVHDILLRAEALAKNPDSARVEKIAVPGHIKQSSILIVKGERQ